MAGRERQDAGVFEHEAERPEEPRGVAGLHAVHHVGNANNAAAWHIVGCGVLGIVTASEHLRPPLLLAVEPTSDGAASVDQDGAAIVCAPSAVFYVLKSIHHEEGPRLTDRKRVRRQVGIKIKWCYWINL